MQNNIEKTIDNIFTSISDEEKLEFESLIINEGLTNVIKDLMKQHNIKSRAELAEKLNVKPPYITNLFRGEKHYNMTILAKMQRIFKTSFIFSAKSLNITEENFSPLKAEVIASSPSNGFQYNDADNINAGAKIIKFKFSSDEAFTDYLKAE